MALIPPRFIDCVIAIGVKNKVGLSWIASGFLYGHFTGKTDGDQHAYVVFLVTNNHVFKDRPEVFLRCNPKGTAAAQVFQLNLLDDESKPLWFSDSDNEHDVAVIAINIRELKEKLKQVTYFRSDTDVANVAKMNEIEVAEGDASFALGFPMGLVGEGRNSVIVRGGPIASIGNMLSKHSSKFLVDITVFPGNSGGPVILSPELVSVSGTTPHGQVYLIGIIASYVPYRDVAISIQTKKPRITFEENSGLTMAHPIDLIESAILIAMQRLKPEETAKAY